MKIRIENGNYANEFRTVNEDGEVVGEVCAPWAQRLGITGPGILEWVPDAEGPHRLQARGDKGVTTLWIEGYSTALVYQETVALRLHTQEFDQRGQVVFTPDMPGGAA